MDKRTVNFNGLNSKDDLGITFTTLNIGQASPKRITVSVPYRNGRLDLTDYFGSVRYDNRTISMQFMIPLFADHMTIYHNVQAQLHGQMAKIEFSADQNWYYYGRLSVGNFSVDGSRWSFDITADCEPYQYQDVEVTKIIDTSGYINLIGGAYVSSQKVTVTEDAVLTFGETTVSLSAGTTTIKLSLEEGNNRIEVTGDTKITVEYKIGRL